MKKTNNNQSYSQRQLRVGEMVKQNLGQIFIRNEAKIPRIDTKVITVTEVRMTPDLKTARAYVIPLGGVEMKETVSILTEYSHLVRKALSKKLDIKFLPKLAFVEDNSFEYAEKIERLIKQSKEKYKENDKDKKRYN
jgi:ribosome-binding factor A